MEIILLEQWEAIFLAPKNVRSLIRRSLGRIGKTDIQRQREKMKRNEAYPGVPMRFLICLQNIYIFCKYIL